MAIVQSEGRPSVIEAFDRVLDKGIVIDAGRVSIVLIDLITHRVRVVVASIDTYLKYSHALRD